MTAGGTRVAVLTPAGAGAIATVEVGGPRAWKLARQLFRPAGKKPLPEMPELHRFWFGTLGDQVVLAVKQTEPEPVIEVHCHGGRRVVQFVVDQFLASGRREPAVVERSGWQNHSRLTPAARQLIHAPTLRTASILLDQYHGAFERALRGILAALREGEAPAEPRAEGSAGASPSRNLAELARFAPVGRHLVEPWTVAVAGPPNAGKSSLVNALAGYQRSVVSAVAGTTRDVVTVPVAFDGWPVELADTAGLREAAGLEGEGVERAKRFLEEADLTVWVMDATDPQQAQDLGLRGGLVVVNKCDQPASWDTSRFPDALRVSALTGEGIAGLAAAIARRLVPDSPPHGAAVPFTPQLAERIEAAHAALLSGRPADAAGFLRACLDLC